MGADVEARRLQVGDQRLTVVGVLPDVAAIHRVFDYLVPEKLADDVRVGTLVRIDLHGRRVGGWVVRMGGDAPADVQLKRIAKVTGWGPPDDVVALTEWAAWRWAGSRTALLGAASPPNAVRGLPTASRAEAVAAISPEPELRRIPPASDVADIAREVVASHGPSIVVCPSHAVAARVAARLRDAGHPTALLPREWARARAGGVSVVGARGAAWAPLPDPAAIVVIDGHDEAHQEERSPSWHAADVAIERARRAAVPCIVTSPCPDLFLTRWRQPVVPARRAERDGWPILDVFDRRGDDPRSGLYGEKLVNLLHRAGRAVVVLNRKGRARLLACGACDELARCDACDAAVSQDDGGGLRCTRCGVVRPKVCVKCGSSAMKTLRVGVSRAREELAALLNVEVGEVTGDSDAVPDAPVVIGTEAVLHRVQRADVVAFLEFDQELLAPRYRAAEEALALLARAGRLVGGRASGGRVAVQTRLPHHAVIAAALHGDPARVTDVERPKRDALGFPPSVAMAAVSGAAATEFVDRLRSLRVLRGVDVLGPADGRWLVRAADHATLADALGAVERPQGRLRLEVDPRRL